MADLAELKRLIEGIQTDLRNKATTEKIDELIKSIEARDEKIVELEKRVELLETRAPTTETQNKLLERKLDDLESYTRRQNLRIVGIPEPDDGSENAGACIEKVKEEILKLGDDVHLDLDHAIDRAHRVGPKKDRRGNPIERAMIVRFTSWRARTLVYKNRKKNNDCRYYVDLTQRRVQLKKKAIKLTKDNEKVDFAYADINNNICLLLKDGKKKFFNSEEELANILANI